MRSLKGFKNASVGCFLVFTIFVLPKIHFFSPKKFYIPVSISSFMFSWQGWPNIFLNEGWQMVPRKLQVLEILRSISKSWNSICDESQSLIFMSFLESQNFEFFCSKVSQHLGESQIYHSPPLKWGGGG